MNPQYINELSATLQKMITQRIGDLLDAELGVRAQPWTVEIVLNCFEDALNTAPSLSIDGIVFAVEKLDRLLGFSGQKKEVRRFLSLATVHIAQRSDTASVKAAVQICQQMFRADKSDSSMISEAAAIEGIARQHLAGLGVEILDNLHKAIVLYQEAQTYSLRGPEWVAGWQMGEARVRVELAAMDIKPVDNLRQAISLYQKARDGFAPGAPDAGLCLMNEGNGFGQLADLGIESEQNLCRALMLYRQALECFPPESVDCNDVLANKRVAVGKLITVLFGETQEPTIETALGVLQNAFKAARPMSTKEIILAVNAVFSLFGRQGREEKALAFVSRAAKYLREKADVQSISAAAELHQHLRLILIRAGESTSYIGEEALYEGCARQQLAAMGVDSINNLQQAVLLYSEANDWLLKASDPTRLGLSQMFEASARFELVKLGIEVEKNLSHIITLCQRARGHDASDSKHTGCCLQCEAAARTELADLGIDVEVNLLQAVELCQQAVERLDANSHFKLRGQILVTQAIAFCRMAEFGTQIEHNLSRAVGVFQQALKDFEPHSSDTGLCQHNFATALVQIADRTIDQYKTADHFMLYWWTRELRQFAESPLIRAVEICKDALKCLDPSSNDMGRCLVTRANAHTLLSELGVEPHFNLHEAITLYRQALGCFVAGSQSAGACRIGEAIARHGLADLGVEPEQNLRIAEELASEAKAWLARRSPNWAKSCQMLAFALQRRGRLEDAYAEVYDALQALEALGGSIRNEASRREFRQAFRSSYQLMVSICLDRAAEFRESRHNREQAEAFHWEAWKWVQLGKARTLQESLRSFLRAPVLDNPELAAECDAVLGEFSRIERIDKGHGSPGVHETEQSANQRTILIARIREMLAHITPLEERGAAETKTPSSEDFKAALRHLASPDRPAITVEFFQTYRGQLGAFIYPARVDQELLPPMWLKGGVIRATRLARRCLSACAVLAREGRARAGTGTRSDSWPSGPECKKARKRLCAIAGILGKMLTPLRALITEKGWNNATLILCPTGALHLLPLAAAHWGDKILLPAPGGEAKPREVECALIDAHPIVHLPTAGLAVEVARRQRPLTRVAYVAAADPFGGLTHIWPEVKDVKQVLTAKNFSVKVFERERATARSLWEHGAEAWIIHLAMHTGMANTFDFCGAEFHDRRLVVLELLSWVRLNKAALAVVATCSSSQPLDLTADDPSALTRAWMLAGATSVIGSLWPLVDERAKEFSQEFYRQWVSEGKPLADAVRVAMLHVRERAAGDIYDWAPFVLVGSGATQVM